MGAVFFMLLMGILFLIALVFILVSTILIITWKVRQSKGKKQRKWWLILSIIFLVINLFIAAIPVGYVFFFRTANNSNQVDAYYSETDTTVYWPMGEYEPITAYFILNGNKYVRFRSGDSDEMFFINYKEGALGALLANIEYDPVYSSWFNDFMWVILSGSTYSEQNISTVVDVENKNDFDFVFVADGHGSASFAGATFHAESTINETKVYYNNLENYNTQTVVCEYYVFADEWVNENGKAYKTMNMSFDINDGVFKEIYDLYDSEDLVEHTIPNKYTVEEEKELRGKPVDGFWSIDMKCYSLDDMVYRSCGLYLIDNQVYLSRLSGGGVYKSNPLPEELNQYIIDTVFNELENSTID